MLPGLHQACVNVCMYTNRKGIHRYGCHQPLLLGLQVSQNLSLGCFSVANDRKPIKKFVLSYMLDQIDLTNVYRRVHPTGADSTFLLRIWNILQLKSCVRSQISLNKLRKTEIISNIVSNYNVTKLEIDNSKETGKFTNM